VTDAQFTINETQTSESAHAQNTGVALRVRMPRMERLVRIVRMPRITDVDLRVRVPRIDVLTVDSFILCPIAQSVQQLD
jgi:hypothetical protein